MRFRPPSKHFGAILDTRWIGVPFSDLEGAIEVLRTSHHTWQAWIKHHAAGDEYLTEYIAATTMLARRNERGGRVKTRLNDDQIAEQAARQAAGKIASRMDAEQLEKLKPGIAELLIRDWRGELFSSPLFECVQCRHRWEKDYADEPCPQCGDGASVWVGEPVPCTPEAKLDLLRNTVDSNGNPRWLDAYDGDGKDIEHGGRPLGDAFALLILAEGDKADLFREKAVERAIEGLAPAPAGTMVSG
jgi:rubrerythrin